MFMAISAFVLQGTLIATSQALAAAGRMPEPSVTLSGSPHFHDQLTGMCTNMAATMPKAIFTMGRSDSGGPEPLLEHLWPVDRRAGSPWISAVRLARPHRDAGVSENPPGLSPAD